MKVNSTKLTSVLLVLFTVYAVYGETRYVKAGSSNPVPPYTSWATASDSIGKCIAAANEGDTILLSEGVFSETFDLKRKMVLQGTDKYQTIISAGTLPRPTPQRYWIISLSDSITIRELTIIGNSNLPSGASVLYAYPVYLRYTVFEDVIFDKLEIGTSMCEGIIRNCRGRIDLLVFIDNPPFSSSVLVENNYIVARGFLATNQRPFQSAGKSHITARKNTIVFSVQEFPITDDLLGPPNQTFDYYNNQFITQGRLTQTTSFRRTHNFVNNSFHAFLYVFPSNQPPAFLLNTNVTFRNNTFSNIDRLFSPSGLSPAGFTYNVVWGAQREPYMDSTNMFDYPMYMNITRHILPGNWPLDPAVVYPCNLRFQRYSLAIDKGDPAIEDIDRTQSDPGAFGGPWGESYAYKDTAPMTPFSGTLVYDDTMHAYKANWNRIYDQDFDRYEFHLDTTLEYISHPYFYEGETRDTFAVIPFAEEYPAWMVFWIRGIDTAGHASQWVIKGVHVVTGIEEEPRLNPVTHEITGIYPNPFNAEAKVEYILGTRGRALFRVYDINGSLLRSIEQGEQDEGRHSITLSLPQYASGVYFVQLEVKEESTGKRILTQSKKIVMVK